MDLKISSAAGGEYEITNIIPAALFKYLIPHAVAYYVYGPWGEILMQGIKTIRGVLWDTWYWMKHDTVLIAEMNQPVTEMQNAMKNAYSAECNDGERITSKEGRGRFIHETYFKNVAFFKRGTAHTSDLHLDTDELHDIASDHPGFYSFVNSAARKEPAEMKQPVIVRGRIEWMINEIIQPYCAPGQKEDYINCKFDEIIRGALWQVDRKDAHQPLKITSAMKDKAVHAKEYLRSHIGEQVPYKVLQQVLQTNIQSLKVAFKSEFGYTMDEYARRTKMAMAKFLLLENPKAEISEVALAVGYGNTKAFSRKFKEYFGIMPTALQK